MLTNNFLLNEWCEFAIQITFIIKGMDGIVLLVMEDLDKLDLRKASRTLCCLLNKGAYIEWGDDNGKQKLFWQKLEDALKF